MVSVSKRLRTCVETWNIISTLTLMADSKEVYTVGHEGRCQQSNLNRLQWVGVERK